MRKIGISLAFLFLLIATSTFGGETKEAVKKAVMGETQAYIANDYDAWEKLWLHEDHVRQVYSSSQFSSVNQGWEKVSESMRNLFDGNNPFENIEIEDMQITIDGNYAFVITVEKVTNKWMGQPFTSMHSTSSVLKNVEGGWKIVSQNILDVDSYKPNAGNAEANINTSGYLLMFAKDMDRALKVFEMNVELFPESFNVYDSLGEAYMNKGDHEKAVYYYKKSLELNPKNQNAREMINKMTAQM